MTYVTVPEMAKMMGIQSGSLYNAISQGRIPYYKIGRSVRLRVEDFRIEPNKEGEMQK